MTPSQLIDHGGGTSREEDAVDEMIRRAALFQGVEASAVTALTTQLRPVEFPHGHVIFA